MNRQLTMLIVDDMEVERISFAEIFKDEYQILEAENGKQAMEQLEQQKVHIVLLDYTKSVQKRYKEILIFPSNFSIIGTVHTRDQ